MKDYHHHTLPVSYEQKQIIDAWCEQHMQGNWYSMTYHRLYGAMPPTWFFAAQSDLALFLLRWR